MRAVLATLLLAGCTAERAGGLAAPIVGGSETRAHPAVGALVLRRARCAERADVLCTVTLIAPAAVLTAGHCVAPYRERQLEVLFGDGVDDPSAVHRVVVRHVVHPRYDRTSSDHDLAVLVLDRPVEIAPIALAEDPLDSSWVGREVRLVGFGEAETNDGAKREGTASIDAVEALTFRIGPSPAMACRGDSGGPALLDIEGATRLIGVTSQGDVDCRAWGEEVRVDVHREDFLEPTLRALVAPPEPSVSLDALCDGQCGSDEDCPAAMICAGEGRCVAPPLELGSIGEACVEDAECASGACVPVDGACACYAPCAPEPPPRAMGCHAGPPTSSTATLLGLLVIAFVCGAARRAR